MLHRFNNPHSKEMMQEFSFKMLETVLEDCPDSEIYVDISGAFSQ